MIYVSLLVLILALAISSVNASDIGLNDDSAYTSDLDLNDNPVSGEDLDLSGLEASNVLADDAGGEDSNLERDSPIGDETNPGENPNSDGDSPGGDETNSEEDFNDENGDSQDEIIKNETIIRAESIRFDYATEGQLKINLTDIDGVALENKTISVKINQIVKYLTTDADGIAIFKFKSNVGTYTALISFDGDNYYNSSSTSAVIKIEKSSTKLKVPKVRSYLTTSTYLNLTLVDSKGKAIANKKVTVVFAGQNYNLTTDSKGFAKLKVPTKVGTYNFTVKFAGDGSYLSSSACSKVVITKMVVNLTAPKVQSYIIKKTYLTITLKNIYGKALANRTITVKINKKNHKLKTNDKGVAKLKFAKKLGKTKCTVKFKGTDNFYGASLNTTVKISKMPTRIIAPKITFNSTKHGKFLITLEDKDGRKMKNRTVTIRIPSAKKVYKVKTNSKGVATFYFSGPKTYNVTVKFAATKSYAASSVKSQFIVKKYKVKFNDVVGAAKLLRNYISENKSLPSKIKYKNYTFTTPQLSYLMAVAIKHIDQKNKNDIVLVAVSTPSKSKGEIYDTVYKKDYLKIVKKAAGSPIKHKTPSYIKYSFYKIPYKVYTAEFSGILDFYGKNKKLPKYSLFTNSEFKKVSKSSKYTFYLTTDNIAGKKSDLKMLKRLAKTLKSKGYEAVIVGIGPNIHYVAYRYGCTGKKSVLLACFGGVDVGCIEEWTGDLGSSNTFQKNYDGAHILGLWYTKPYGSSSNIHKPIGRAWDANYGFALKNPAKYMAKHNISYIQTGTVTSACNRLKAGKMGGPKLIK